MMTGGLKKRNTKICLYFFVYTVLFILFSILMFVPLIRMNKIPVWGTDAYPVMYPAFSFLGDCIKSESFSFLSSNYSLNIGLGNDLFSFLGNWYLEPLSFLSGIVSGKYTEILYVLLIGVRYYLAGAAFSVYCLYMKRGYLPALISSFVYTFSVFSLVMGTKWPLFLVPMIYFPLLLIGVERLLTGKFSKFFVFMVFLQAWTSYYFLFISTILGCVYFFARFLEIYGIHFRQKDWRRRLLTCAAKTGGAYLLGAAMACVTIFPNAMTLLNSNRGDTLDLGVESFLYYGKGWIGGVIKYFISSVQLWAYSPLPEFDLFIGVAPICIFAVCILAAGTPLKQRLDMKISLIFGGIFLIFPIFGYILSGFSNINHRWAYGLVFLISFISCCYLPEFRLRNRKALLLFALFTAGYGILAYREGTENIYVFSAFILLCISLVWAAVGSCAKIPYRIHMCLTFVLVAASLLANGYLLYGRSGYAEQLADAGTLASMSGEYDQDGVDIVQQEDAALYRIDRGIMNRESVNSALLNHYNGLSFYHNTMDQFTTKYMQEVGNCDLKERILNYGLDSRTYLNALAGVKYYIPVWQEDPYLPYGYEKNESLSTSDYIVYENQYALPLVFSYENTMNAEEYDSLNALQKQEAMLQAVVLNTESSDSEEEVQYTSSEADYRISGQHNVEIKDGTVHLLDDYYTEGGYIDISFTGKEETETYLYLKGLNIDEAGFADWTFVIERSSDHMSKEVSVLSMQNPYNPGMNDYWVNLGYQEEAQKKFRIYIPGGAQDFKLNDIRVYCQGFERYEDYIRDLQQESAENIQMEDNTLTCSMHLTSDRWLFFSIPYSEGWTLYVDGEETELERANTMYMAAELTAGDHEISLQYQTPGLKEGLIVSAVAWGMFIVLAVFLRIRRKS